MHNGKMFPLWQHGEAQTPEIEHYLGLFTDEYMDDWRHKTIEWEVPVGERIMCECEIVKFVETIEIDSITFRSTQRTRPTSNAAIMTPCSACLRGSGFHRRVLPLKELLQGYRILATASTSRTTF
jgi:hypothetical protein